MRYCLGILTLLLALPVAAQPREFRDCPDCPVMIAVPPGTLTLPAPAPPPQQGRRRAPPPAPVALTVRPGVALGKYPVTRDEFQAFMQSGSHSIDAQSCFHLPDGDGTSFSGVAGTWLAPPFEQTGRDPVVCVSRRDALAYVAWLSRHTGRRYRLPDQVEWEYAARAGTLTPRYWTEDPEQACLYANAADRTIAAEYGIEPTTPFLLPCEDGFVHTSPVGSLRPNAFGFHDMLGNVRQLMMDCTPPDHVIRPTIRVRPGPPDCAPFATLYFVRGSSWMQGRGALDVETFYDVFADGRFSSIGFRVARSE